MKAATRLKLLIAGVAIMVVAVVMWVSVISWEWLTFDRNTVFLLTRCMYSVGYAVVFVAACHYWQELKPHPPFRPWRMILGGIGATYIFTVAGVNVLLEWYPDAPCSIRWLLIYTILLILMLIETPVRHHAVRYYRNRKGMMSH